MPGAARQLSRALVAALAVALGGALAGAGAAACGPPPHPAAPGPRVAGVVPRCDAAPVPGAALVLPAGLYFRPDTYVAGRCDGCPTPTHAALLGVHALPADAARAAAAVPPEVLPPGYPWVVHTDDLWLAGDRRRGLAVVAGLFASRADAERWLAAAPCLQAQVTLAPLREGLTEEERPREPRVTVVRVEPGRPVAAYDPAALDRLEEAIPDTGADADEARRAAAGRLTPLCTVAAGAVFTFPVGEYGYAEAVYRYRRQWAPVRCGARLAYVPWTSTLLESLIQRQPDGSYRIHQVTAVECDRATWEDWPYDARGRREHNRAFAARVGCR